MGEYEAKELNYIEMEYEKQRKMGIGWLAGVPEDILESVQSQLG